MPATAVGVLGAGRMGSSIARFVAAAGHDVYVRDPGIDAADVPDGARLAPHAEPFVRDVGVVIVTVPYGDALEAALAEADSGIFHTECRRERVIVLSSTVPPDRMPALERTLRQQGISLLECPLCRGSDGVAAGEALALVAGPSDVVEQVRPILSTYASDIEYLGDAYGDAQRVKSINNLMLWASVAGTVAGLHLARTVKTSEDELRRIISSSTGDSWALRQWDRHGVWPWALKDLDILIDSGELDPADGDLVRALRQHLSLADELNHADG